MPQPEVTGLASPADYYATATQSLRSAAQWLLGAAAAVGGVLVAGVQLTSLGALALSDWPRLVAAGCGLALALAAVAYVIMQAGRLLSDEWVSLAHLDLKAFEGRLGAAGNQRERKRRELLEEVRSQLLLYQDELYADVADSTEELYRRLMKANQDARSGVADVETEVVRVRQAAVAAVQFANYQFTRRRFQQLQAQMAVAMVPVVVGVTVFAYAANPAPRAPGSSSEQQPASAAAAWLNGPLGAEPATPFRGQP